MKNEYGSIVRMGSNYLLILSKSWKNPKGGKRWFKTEQSAQKAFTKYC